MAGFFERLTGRQNKRDESSAAAARERLRLVLVHDRMNLPPEKMKAMKEEILAVIARYIPLESEEIDIALTQRDDNSNKLIAEVPFSKHAYAAVMDNENEDDIDAEDSTFTEDSPFNDDKDESEDILMVITVDDDPEDDTQL